MNYNYSVSKYNRLFLFYRLTMYTYSHYTHTYDWHAMRNMLSKLSYRMTERNREKGVASSPLKTYEMGITHSQMFKIQLKIDDKRYDLHILFTIPIYSLQRLIIQRNCCCHFHFEAQKVLRTK